MERRREGCADEPTKLTQPKQPTRESPDLASRASDEHIAMLPSHHRDIVRMLRRAAADARHAEDARSATIEVD